MILFLHLQTHGRTILQRPNNNNEPFYNDAIIFFNLVTAISMVANLKIKLPLIVLINDVANYEFNKKKANVRW